MSNKYKKCTKLISNVCFCTFIFTVFSALMPIEHRQKEFIEKTHVTKNIAYKRALQWFQKTINNSNDAIQSKDEAEAKITTKVVINCSAIPAVGPWHLDFIVDFSAKDKKVKFVFEHILMTHPSQKTNTNPFSGLLGDQRQPKGTEELVKITEECIEPIKKSILEAINATEKEW